MQNNSKKEQQHKRGLPLSVWLGYLVAITLVLNGVTMAKFTSTASGSATATAAKFDVALEAAPDSLELKSNDNEYESVTNNTTVTVTSDSEVAVAYSLVVSFAEAPPSGMTIQVDSQTAQNSNGTNKSFSFTGGTFSLNDSTPKEHTLTINADLNTILRDTNLEMTVTAQAVQVD